MYAPNLVETSTSTGGLFNRVRQRVSSMAKPTLPTIYRAPATASPTSEARPPFSTPASQDRVWAYMVETPEMRTMYNMFQQYAVKQSMTAQMKIARLGLLEKLRFVLCNQPRCDSTTTRQPRTTAINSRLVNTNPLCKLTASFVDAMSSELTLHLSRTTSLIMWFECPAELSNVITAAAEEIESSLFFDYLRRRGPAQLMNSGCALTIVAAWITATSPSWMRILISSAAGIDRASNRTQLRRELQVALELRESELIAPAFACGLERVATLRRRLMAEMDDAIGRMVTEKRYTLALEQPVKEDRLERQPGKRSTQLGRFLGIRSAIRAGYEYHDVQAPEAADSEE